MWVRADVVVRHTRLALLEVSHEAEHVPGAFRVLHAGDGRVVVVPHRGWLGQRPKMQREHQDNCTKKRNGTIGNTTDTAEAKKKQQMLNNISFAL